ncbi:hypothetical protein HYG77_36385 (plasmid) [Rhodococcus sp. ZPP]|nr:hypothetical protein [Rhodococcus erythropolis]QTJ70975.1 hypothetical protein HYG77_36385 [Rhodococcus sp. ZPP]
MIKRSWSVRSLAVVGLLALPLTGCASGSDSGSGDATSAVSAGPASVSSTTPAPPEDGGLVIPVRIEGSEVTPSNERIDATVGEKITLRVDSDTDEEIHVHSVPNYSFTVQPTADQLFTFSVDVPGQVAVEVHHHDKTLATLIVR